MPIIRDTILKEITAIIKTVKTDSLGKYWIYDFCLEGRIIEADRKIYANDIFPPFEKLTEDEEKQLISEVE